MLYIFTAHGVALFNSLDRVAINPLQLRRHAEARGNLAAIAEDMTPEQITAGEAFAKQWETSHPPMSELRLTFNDVG